LLPIRDISARAPFLIVPRLRHTDGANDRTNPPVAGVSRAGKDDLFAGPTLTDDLYHYTSSSVALDSVLAQGRLRLGLVELMNDPYESRPRYPNLSIAEGVPELGPDHGQTMKEADRLLRRAAKVACFTCDYELPDSVLNPQALPGYAHPALWAHYAAGHPGVCLRFSRRALAERLRSQLGPRGLLFDGAVEYPLEMAFRAQAMGLDVEQIHEFGLDVVVTRYIERYHRELFFVKHTDWAEEREYRWVFVDPEPSPVYVTVAGALAGLVLGDAFPETRMDAVHHLAARFDLDVTRVHFFNRWLHVTPVPQPAIRLPPVPRRKGSFASRVREVSEAESDAEQASQLGEQVAAPILGQIEVLMEQIAARVAELPGVEVALHNSAVAIPPKERRRAPGVPTYSADYEKGVMCVVENLPRYSLTFVASSAVQAIANKRLKLHAAFELERWRKDEPNERVELWRFAAEDSPDAAAVLGSRLVAEMTEHLDPALNEFEKRRGSL
jgi:hypothetical protein